MAARMKLFQSPAQGGSEQLVAEMITAQRPPHAPSFVLKDRYLILGYTREALPPCISFLLTTATGDLKGISRFRAYLAERKKIAIAKSDDGSQLFIAAGDSEGHLLGCAPATSNIEKPVGAAAHVRSARDFESGVEDDLRLFEADPEFNGPVAFEPMDKALQFIVHDVVEQVNLRAKVSLVSVSAGDGEERHIEVYRRGFEPAPSLIAISGVTVTKPNAATRKPSSQVLVDPARPPEGLKKVNQVRDRRSVEEVLLERSQMKKARTGADEQYEKAEQH